MFLKKDDFDKFAKAHDAIGVVCCQKMQRKKLLESRFSESSDEDMPMDIDNSNARPTNGSSEVIMIMCVIIMTMEPLLASAMLAIITMFVINTVRKGNRKKKKEEQINGHSKHLLLLMQREVFCNFL